MWKKASTAVLCGALALSLAACGGGGDSDDTIKIGVISPQTGPSSDPGQRVREGAKIALAMVNEEGGVDGRDLEIKFADDAGTPEDGVLKMKEMSAEGVHYFTGTVNSTVGIAIGNFLLKSKDVYVMTTAQTDEPLLAQTNGNIFAMGNTNAQFGSVYLPWIQNNLKPRTVAVLAETSDYGNNEIATLESTWQGAGAPEILVERFDREQSDYSAQLTKLISKKPDALYAVAGGTDLPAKILKQAKELGFQGQGLSGPSTISGAFIEAGGADVEGVVSANVYSTTLDNEVNAEFVKRFEAEYGRLPSAEAALGYDSVWTIVQAMNSVDDPTDTAAVAKAYRDGTWETTRGERGFDDTGRLVNETYIVKVESGNPVILQ